jgi:GDP-4-dehydro-6-deoxy-D-mannose reductase
MGTVNVLESIRCYVPDCRVLLVGSFAEYGPVDLACLPVTEETACQPAGAYGIAKYAATLTGIDYARRYSLRVIVARPSNIIGPGVPESLVVGTLLARAKQALALTHPVVKVGDFDSERDFVAVTDAVDAYVRLLESEAWGEVFNICSGRACSIRYVAEALLANSSRPIDLELDGTLVPPSIIRSLYGSYEKAVRRIGFRPSTSLEESLKDTWNAEMGAGIACA